MVFVRRAALAAGLLWALCAQAQPVLNLYSARHYQTDEALYDNVTKATGIRIPRVDADDAGILSRLKAEGSASPADVILLVDAARLWTAQNEGLFQPVQSKLLEEAWRKNRCQDYKPDANAAAPIPPTIKPAPVRAGRSKASAAN